MIAPDFFEGLIRAGAPREQITLYGRVEWRPRDWPALSARFLGVIHRTARGRRSCVPTLLPRSSTTRQRVSGTRPCGGGRRLGRPASVYAGAAASRPGRLMASRPMLQTAMRSLPMLSRARRTSGSSYDAQRKETVSAAAARLYAPQAARRRALGLLLYAPELGAQPAGGRGPRALPGGLRGVGHRL